MIEFIDTDILNLPNYGILLHQFNCCGELTNGLLSRISKKFPGWYDDIRKYTKWWEHARRSELLGSTHNFRVNSGKNIICSAFTQVRPPNAQAAQQDTDYNAWSRVFKKVEYQTRYQNGSNIQKWTVHIPDGLGTFRISTGGLGGGGDPAEMDKLIRKFFENSTVELVIHTRS